jgi:hypothetical protein
LNTCEGLRDKPAAQFVGTVQNLPARRGRLLKARAGNGRRG